MGYCETYLSKIMGAKQQILSLELKEGKGAGIILAGKTMIEHQEIQVQE
jgi:hypothetical protein